jgi:hypothetical protein
MRSIVDPPPASAMARFDPEFGQRFLLTIETGDGMEAGEPYLDHSSQLAQFQALCEHEDVAPVYLLDWATAQCGQTAEAIRGPLASGRAEAGALTRPSGAGLARLCEAIEANVGAAPLIHRTGPGSAGPDMADVLAAPGILFDSSVRARFDLTARGGPDYRRHPPAPYWLDDGHRLLELPVTAAFWGPLRREGEWLHPALDGWPRLREWLGRASLLERIPLTPQGVSVDEAIRAIDITLDDGIPLLVFSFGSSSLQPGQRPCVRDEAELSEFYDWWRRVFAYLELREVAPVTLTQIAKAVRR